MPERELTIRQLLWRAYVPQWAHDPLSGAGAALFGGRWNALGQPCFYAARELSTAWAEYNQGLVQHPATIVRLVLSNARLADLTDESFCRVMTVKPAIHKTEWRAAFDAGRVPKTHQVAKRLLDQDYDGVIYPSFMSHGGSCVALWRWNTENTPRLRAIDPQRRLPKGPASWL